MQTLSRIVWSEGMHLAQHHFQAQTAWFERLTGAAVSDLFQAPYGLLSSELDADALLNGTASLIAARGIMPDGLPFSFPEEPAPPTLSVTELFSPTQSAHVLLLALPPEQPGRANANLPGADARADARYSAVELSLVDETTGAEARAVQLAHKNFRLLLDTEVPPDLVTLPIARIERDGAGRFRYDPTWIGPSLRISASPRLQVLVARLVEMLEERASAIRAERQASAGSAEYAPREIAGFWFLHALNSALPTLRHWHRTGAAHPEQLYLLLAQLGGALCTFSMTSQPHDLPAYDHDAPEACFTALDTHIRRHLEVVLPTSAIMLEVRPSEAGFYAAGVTDERCFAPNARWYLGLRTSASGGEAIARITRLVKLCSSRFIGRLVREAYPGLAVEHVAVPPPELSPRLGTHYFALQRTDPCWRSIVDTKEVGLYVPAAVPEAELELKVVLDRPA
jgi:type VI secretion system protein ImpJ